MARRIDFRPQLGEKTGKRLHLVQDHEALAVPREKKVGPRQSKAVGLAFQIEEQGAGRLPGQDPRQGGFAHLAGPEQDHRWLLLQPKAQEREQFPRNHPGILSGSRSNCKVDALAFRCAAMRSRGLASRQGPARNIAGFGDRWCGLGGQCPPDRLRERNRFRNL
jgi:hypothetical protein